MARQMPPGRLNLLFDQIEIVEKPFGRRGDMPSLVNCECGSIEGSKNPFVIVEPPEKPVRAGADSDSMFFGNFLSVEREWLNAQ